MTGGHPPSTGSSSSWNVRDEALRGASDDCEMSAHVWPAVSVETSQDFLVRGSPPY